MHPDTTIRLANLLDLEGLGALFDQYPGNSMTAHLTSIRRAAG